MAKVEQRPMFKVGDVIEHVNQLEFFDSVYKIKKLDYTNNRYVLEEPNNYIDFLYANYFYKLSKQTETEKDIAEWLK
jgi:hypothetical protein